MTARPETSCPPAVGAVEGQCIAVVTSAASSYSPPPTQGKRGLVASVYRRAGRDCRSVAFRSATGSVYRYSGKRGRVLAMLASRPDGVTQWDCLPWHTRLGGSIHIMRRDGLVIETIPEGEYRHARYRLATPGCLIIPANNTEKPDAMLPGESS